MDDFRTIIPKSTAHWGLVATLRCMGAGVPNRETLQASAPSTITTMIDYRIWAGVLVRYGSSEYFLETDHTR